ncbi:MAG: acetoacetyl-CoA synthase [Methylothermaceae bacteria B42]|nr:MAG: acetoacetyl-CoA synthase [Methylothermaceae bacteria B42]HHJ39995.1 acetoacetyl-CoA synthase [Methylothermaceae bacterium]
MQLPYNIQAPKKPTNLSINSDLLKKAKDMNINLSATLEQALTELLIQKERESWQKENRKAIHQYNSFIDKNGVFSDGLKNF